MLRVFSFRLSSVIWLLVVAFSSTKNSLFAQETPSLQLQMFNYSTTFRQSVCERQAQLDNNTLLLRNALEGLELSTWIYKDNRYVYFDDDRLDPTNSGLIADLLDALATRAQFTWRNSFGVMDNLTLPPGRSFTDLLVWSTWAFDISGAYWTRNIARMDRGASFPEGWCKYSTV